MFRLGAPLIKILPITDLMTHDWVWSKQLQSWNAHLSKVRKENPKLSLKAAMEKASASYKPAKKPK